MASESENENPKEIGFTAITYYVAGIAQFILGGVALFESLCTVLGAPNLFSKVTNLESLVLCGFALLAMGIYSLICAAVKGRR